MNKRKFLMLADDYSTKVDVSGWWVSEKADGERALWDGGISRGLDAREVPWANTSKDARFLVRPIATGLWSRQGKVIHAPGPWLDGLPIGITLDMELWMGRGTFQRLRSIASKIEPDEAAWRQVKGMAIDSPSWDTILADGEISEPQWKTYLDRGMLAWVDARTALLSDGRLAAAMAASGCRHHPGMGQPDECFSRLARLHEAGASWRPMVQTKLPNDLDAARAEIDDMLALVAEGRGEGLMLRSPTSPWVPKRVPWLLKVKKLRDAEGVVTGYTWGRETTLGSKLLGKMGALVVTCHTGKRLELSGFTDGEREMVPSGDGAVDREGFLRPGEVAQTWRSSHYPIGSKVTYTFTELSDDGVPKCARFLRGRDE